MDVSVLPLGKQKPALSFRHFPSTWQAVLWRNWGIIPLPRLAKMLGCSQEKLLQAGEQLGLEPDDSLCELWLKRGYQTIIRQNWHLLSYEQLLLALDWSAEKLEYILREDDFLWTKMGNFKPQLTPPQYAELDELQLAKTGKLKKWRLETTATLPERQEKPFDFLHASYNEKLSLPEPDGGLRLIYSYSALYGDPLLDEAADPYPEQLLADYAASGINAVWMQAVLYSLVPWFGQSEYSKDCEKRLQNLQKLVRRLQKHGLKLILYINEPRAMPEAFFKLHPAWRGAVSKSNPDLYALCTSNPEVLDMLSKGLEELFRKVPELGGVLCITMSENLTNCFSKTPPAEQPDCPLCARRSPQEVIVEILQAIEQGVHKANPQAEVIAWSWGWAPDWDEELLAAFPPNVKLQMVSETHLETHCCGGIRGSVSDYSISKPGPGPTFVRLAEKARKQGIPLIAKVQLNNTWENSATPYIPVPGLVEEHLGNLRNLGVKDFMVSWTLGGYPGGNLPLLSISKEELLQQKFGAAAGEILKACSFFDQAFRHFPLNGTAQLYTAPQNYGPANLLFTQETGYKATMVGFPYDDISTWTGHDFYPGQRFEEAFGKLSELWQVGMNVLQNARQIMPAEKLPAYEDLWRVAQASSCHFLSTWLQIMFVRRRKIGDRAGMLTALQGELEQCALLLELCRLDSRIGFEASNHYYYNENTLLEKILNCQQLIRELQ